MRSFCKRTWSSEGSMHTKVLTESFSRLPSGHAQSTPRPSPSHPKGNSCAYISVFQDTLLRTLHFWTVFVFHWDCPLKLISVEYWARKGTLGNTFTVDMKELKLWGVWHPLFSNSHFSVDGLFPFVIHSLHWLSKLISFFLSHGFALNHFASQRLLL